MIITSGGSGALEIAISCLLNEGDALLVPNPGFALYQVTTDHLWGCSCSYLEVSSIIPYPQVITKSLGGSVQAYDLLPDQNWEIDLAHLESLIDVHTKAILINNPSNPTGNILSKGM